MFVGKNKQQLTFEMQFFGPPISIPENDPYLIIERKIDWDDLLSNLKKFYSYNGKSSIPVKNLVLLLLFKHYRNCSDVEIVEALAGSLPMQKALNITFQEAQIKYRKEFYFKKYKKKEIKIKGYIHPVTLSTFRSRIGLDGMEMITRACDKVTKKKQKSKTVILDTTVCPSDIAYPTDINLLEKARQVLLRELKEITKGLGLKLRTYSQTARKEFLSYIKLGRKKNKSSRKVHGKMIRFLRRNLKQIKEAYKKQLESINAEQLIKIEEIKLPPLIQAIEKMLEQQKELFKKTPRSGKKFGIQIKDRIVSIFKSHVRPMSRGKIPNPTEFGAKILLELRDGFITLLKTTFNNEADSDMVKDSFERWKGLIVGGDRGIHSKENERLAKEHGVKKFYVEKKGKKSLEKTNGVKRIRKIRPAIEAKISLAKRKFGLNRNRYKRGEEGETQWLHLAINAMNLRLFVRKAQL